MKREFIILFFIFTGVFSAYSQKDNVTLVFSGNDDGKHVVLDSIELMNQSQGNVNMLYWPDTIAYLNVTLGDTFLIVGYIQDSPSSIEEIVTSNTFSVSQMMPNPVVNSGEFSVELPEDGNVNIRLSDIYGKIYISREFALDRGSHTFQFMPGQNSVYLLIIQFKGITNTIKVISGGHTNNFNCSLDYMGNDVINDPFEKQDLKSTANTLQSGFITAVTGDTSYDFQFAKNIPCPGEPTVSYGGQVYNTIQIFNQCWLKENLNIGSMLTAPDEFFENNGMPEKYCYQNIPDNCIEYGGLYSWSELMQYTTVPGSQGLCPPGYHVPTDDEWAILEGSVDVKYDITDPMWTTVLGSRGYTSGLALKTYTGWTSGGGTNSFDFSAVPGGAYIYTSNFQWEGYMGYWWTSSDIIPGGYIYRRLVGGYDGSDRKEMMGINAASARCIKNY